MVSIYFDLDFLILKTKAIITLNLAYRNKWKHNLLTFFLTSCYLFVTRAKLLGNLVKQKAIPNFHLLYIPKLAFE